MGSVLSFVILCVINLCVYWDAVEPDVIRFNDLAVLINGDDILFRCDQEKYNRWLATLPQAGLFPSPGKNFYHNVFCTVNSELFSVRGETVKCIPFFNAGMLLGQSKVCRTELKSKPVFTLHEQVLRGACNPVRADSRFKYYNSEKLQRCSKSEDGVQMNYYVSRKLGGLGMCLPGMLFLSAERFKQLQDKGVHPPAPYTIVTGAQRKIAQYLYDKWTKPYFKPPMKPIGEEVDMDREDYGFVDIKDMSFKICVPDRRAPMPPWCRPLESNYHPPNWDSPPMDSNEAEVLKFQSRGVRLYRSAKMKIPCHHMMTDFTEYKYAGCSWWREVVNESRGIAESYDELQSQIGIQWEIATKAERRIDEFNRCAWDGMSCDDRAWFAKICD